MRVEFNGGVPDGCARWLCENVGPGNIEEDNSYNRTRQSTIDKPEYAWFYERVFVPNQETFSGEGCNVPTITIKDERLATLFLLRWT